MESDVDTGMPETAPTATEAAPVEPAATQALHDDPAIAKALEGLTLEQRETLLTTGGRNAISALKQKVAEAKTSRQAEVAEAARTDLAQQIGKALGLIKDDEQADPAKLTEQLTQSQQNARQAQLELAVYRAATGIDADPSVLLDSRSFLARVADVDPNDHLAIAAAVGEALMDNPLFGKAPARRAPAPNPAAGTSGNGVPGLDDLIAQAQKAGDFRQVIHLQNQKLSAPKRP